MFKMKTITKLMLICIVSSCNSAEQFENERKDALDSSLVISTQKNDDKLTLKADTLYDSLISYFADFKSDNAEEIEITIPKRIVASILSQEEFDFEGNFYINTTPVIYFENIYGNIFILKVNCSAGGNCAIFYLVMFDKTKQRMKVTKIGEETGEEDESIFFKYTLLNDSTILEANQLIYKDPNGDPSDSIKRQFKLDNSFIQN